MRASLGRFGIVVGLLVTLAPAIVRGQSTPPPCPPGTKLATIDMSQTGALDNDVLPIPTDVTATHNATFGAAVDFSGGAASVNNSVTVTAPPGVVSTPVPPDSPSVASVDFVAPATPQTLLFTVTWTQAVNYPSTQDCTASTQIPITTVADTPTKISHVFGALQHWSGHRGSPLNVLSVGWTLVVDRYHGDGEPITVTARSGSAPPVSSTFSPFHLHLYPLTAKSSLVRLRSATTGPDDRGTHLIDVVNASVLVYPARRGATVHRSLAVDITQGSEALAHYRIVTTCRVRRHLTCRPIPR
jgi:hypothetical protein